MIHCFDLFVPDYGDTPQEDYVFDLRELGERRALIGGSHHTAGMRPRDLFDFARLPRIDRGLRKTKQEGINIPYTIRNATPLEVENIILGDSQDDSADNEEDSDVCSDEVDSSDDSESSLESDYE
ncbi:hypothetical protein EVAR_42735_1 [Eumeta japonica]|uniref:Uncharacterized protein n=1 Tax=Eumeta variegata TaxID=151549 RepID=A0A4C1XIJ4_EUMVA|nr:hypothetical protein EVAR_42735_1 [Eumeta japonica]